MVESFAHLPAFTQALLAATFTWLVTALGAAAVFLFRGAPRRLMDALLGFAGGIMVAASCWSLLIPAMERGGIIPAAVGLVLGAAFLFLLDQVLPHVHFLGGTPEGVDTRWHQSILLVLAITLHNIPEGLAIGVAFAGGEVGAAVALAVGIGVQNFPEGLAVALPLRRQGLPVFRSFWYGQLSAVVEPVAAVAGVVLVSAMHPLLPYALAFAGGAMLYVVVEEMIPEASREGHGDLATLGFILGFVVMMSLDNALG